ncbi:MAG: protoporphyrinogen oxidase, partial [Candidatus Acidiferrum sp.]
MKKVAIIGGGISGLSAAFYLEQARRRGVQLEYVLYETKRYHLGGSLHTEQVNGFTVESGADSFLTEKPWALELCRELGIEDQLISSNDAQRKTYILRNRELVGLPAGLTFFIPADVEAAVQSNLFSAQTRQRIREEVKLQPVRHAADHDESVRSFVERHFGSEMAERVAAPLLAGIYGGDIGKLSMRAVLPRFLAMEAKHGSLIKALTASMPLEPAPKQPLFTSFRSGMQTLVNALLK